VACQAPPLPFGDRSPRFAGARAAAGSGSDQWYSRLWPLRIPPDRMEPRMVFLIRPDAGWRCRWLSTVRSHLRAALEVVSAGLSNRSRI